MTFTQNIIFFLKLTFLKNAHSSLWTPLAATGTRGTFTFKCTTVLMSVLDVVFLANFQRMSNPFSSKIQYIWRKQYTEHKLMHHDGLFFSSHFVSKLNSRSTRFGISSSKQTGPVFREHVLFRLFENRFCDCRFAVSTNVLSDLTLITRFSVIVSMFSSFDPPRTDRTRTRVVVPKLRSSSSTP